MRKHFALVLLTVALTSVLTGCGEKENNDTYRNKDRDTCYQMLTICYRVYTKC